MPVLGVLLMLLPEEPVVLEPVVLEPVVLEPVEPLPNLLLAWLVSVPFALACSERDSLPSPSLSSVANWDAWAEAANSCWLMLPSLFASRDVKVWREESLVPAVLEGA